MASHGYRTGGTCCAQTPIMVAEESSLEPGVKVNHIDGCSYMYESWGQPGTTTKTRYLEKARKILELSRRTGLVLRELLEVLA